MATVQVVSLTDGSTISLNKPSSLFHNIKHPHASSSSSSSSSSVSRRQLITQTATTTLLLSASQALAAVQEPQRRYLPIHHPALFLLLDHPNHGLQTKDGGSTWVPLPLSTPFAEDGDFNYRFKSISFNGKEGWVVGKPAILLDTSNAGENLKQISFSSQLPGDTSSTPSPKERGMTMTSASTQHYHGDRIKSGRKEERPRFFDSNAKSLCWAKAATVPGRHPDRWRKDAAGNVVCRRFHSCQGCLCYEYDHIIPFSKGGLSMAENCQILQTRVNRFKSDKDNVRMTRLKGYSCDIQFSDKELDIIEMAVYGDVLRQGNLCRVGTIDEMHGTYKSKDRLSSCKLP